MKVIRASRLHITCFTQSLRSSFSQPEMRKLVLKPVQIWNLSTRQTLQGHCCKWELQKGKVKERVRQDSVKLWSKHCWRKKKGAAFQPQGTGPGCCKSVQKRAKLDKKNILCEWRAGRKLDRADDQRADMKWVQTAGFLPFFYMTHVDDW